MQIFQGSLFHNSWVQIQRKNVRQNSLIFDFVMPEIQIVTRVSMYGGM
ncbi:hypothetical protein BG20_I1442 [Candidatus Nitrosarchaeum limnium BG20]|uniref:Uncharacterized protein n=1 Tax=Candidatus Nitrosarchaeum limnium BG20 TaxID=859192 RepID=S2EXD7_9ARCH|nr:hypothetical protein BG20_I1442 [Candidatus Nitrosarchaeum limnium BG20]